jgi:hypothetical protein
MAPGRGITETVPVTTSKPVTKPPWPAWAIRSNIGDTR